MYKICSIAPVCFWVVRIHKWPGLIMVVIGLCSRKSVSHDTLPTTPVRVFSCSARPLDASNSIHLIDHTTSRIYFPLRRTARDDLPQPLPFLWFTLRFPMNSGSFRSAQCPVLVPDTVREDYPLDLRRWVHHPTNSQRRRRDVRSPWIKGGREYGRTGSQFRSERQGDYHCYGSRLCLTIRCRILR